MQVKKLLFFLFFLTNCLFFLSGNENIINSEIEKKEIITFYAGINPMALLSFLPNGMGTYSTFFGVFSGQEFGISLYGGIHFTKAHSLEMRLSTGPGSIAVWDTQLQFGYIWYPLEQLLNFNSGLCTGFMIRQFFWNNRVTDYVTFNLTPELLLGWRFKVKSLAFDVRAGWNIASVTWSTIPHTKTGTGWIPFPYNLALTTGIAWMF